MRLLRRDGRAHVTGAQRRHERRVADDHAALVAALRARDVRAAVAVQKSHRDASVSAVTAALAGA